MVFEGLHIENRDLKQLCSLMGPDKPTELHKSHDIATVSAARVIGFAAVEPSLEDAATELKKVSTRASTSGVCVPEITEGNAGNVSWPTIAASSSSHTPILESLQLPITEFIGSDNREGIHFRRL
jgi:hypothetical protein